MLLFWILTRFQTGTIQKYLYSILVHLNENFGNVDMDANTGKIIEGGARVSDKFYARVRQTPTIAVINRFQGGPGVTR